MNSFLEGVDKQVHDYKIKKGYVHQVETFLLEDNDMDVSSIVFLKSPPPVESARFKFGE
jgi:hypothetical protein